MNTNIASATTSPVLGMSMQQQAALAQPEDFTSSVFGLKLFRRTHQRVIQYLRDSVNNQESKTLFFVNAHTINTMFSKSEYRHCLEQADMLLPDGIGIELAVRWKGHSLEENLCGTDFIEPLARSGLRLFLLGGEGSTAARAAQMFEQRWGANIVGTHHGYIHSYTEEENDELFATIQASEADVVLVGMGQPLQEEWINQHRDRLEAPIAMGVGGLFDYFSGNVKRAPLLWRKARIEWLYRMMQEPERLWRRYILGNPMFLWRMLQA